MDLQGIYIRSHQERTSPDKHLAYAIEVHGPRGRTWTVWRRYSDFETLVKDMEMEVKSQPSVGTGKAKGEAYQLPTLPPKRGGIGSMITAPLSVFSSGSSNKDDIFIKDRQAGLERFLRSIIGSTNDGAVPYRQSHAFRQFIAAPSSSTTSPGKTDKSILHSDVHFTSSSWLEEYHALDSVSKEIQSLINRRDTLAARGGDTTQSHQANVDAKKLLASLVSRLTVLMKGLDDIAVSSGGLSEGELRRRTDMVAKIQDRAEIQGKMTAASTSSSRAAASSSRSSGGDPASRDALLGSSSTSKPVTRVLGKSQPVQETAQTRVLDNSGLLQLQMQELDAQDDRLTSLTAVIRRQRELAAAIGVELEQQNELLDSFSNDVDRTSGKLAKAKVQMRRLE